VFGEINWTRWTLLLVILLALAASNETRIGRSQREERRPMPILTGKWKLDTGETIEIKQDSSGNVTANFTPSVRCLTNSTRTILFSAPLKMTGTPDAEKATLESDQFSACTRTPAMVTECGVRESFMTKFRAEVTEFGMS
jgi:hypothetical protein